MCILYFLWSIFVHSQLIEAFWFVERFKMGSNLVSSTHTSERERERERTVGTQTIWYFCEPAISIVCGEYYKSKCWHNTRFRRCTLCAWQQFPFACSRIKSDQASQQAMQLRDQVYICVRFLLLITFEYMCNYFDYDLDAVAVACTSAKRNTNKTWSRYICKKDKWCMWFEIKTP